MGYHEGTKLVDDPVIVYLNGKIRLQRCRIEWLFKIRLPEVQRNAASQIEDTLNDGGLQHASVAVLDIKRVLEMIDEEAELLQVFISERSNLLGTELSEEIYCLEEEFFKANGWRWST